MFLSNVDGLIDLSICLAQFTQQVVTFALFVTLLGFVNHVEL